MGANIVDMPTRPWTILSSFPLALLVGCGGGNSPAKCVAGATVACACMGQQSGVQTCTSSGTFAVCACATPTVDAGFAGGALAVFAGVPFGEGSANGTGAAARFAGPSGVAVDGAGNVFVADSGNNTIRKITPSGVVTTLAGTAGWPGGADGTGAAASFHFENYYSSGVAVDGAGYVFVADDSNDTIRKITPAGVVTTLAGTAGLSGSADGTGAAARFHHGPLRCGGGRGGQRLRRRQTPTTPSARSRLLAW
jgi:hypothetical protein